MIRLAGIGLAAVLAVSALLGDSPPARSQDVIIGAGDPQSVDFQVGRVLCRMLIRSREGFDCTPLGSPDALFNLSNVQGGAIEFGLVASDWQFHAVHHSGPFRFMDGRYENLRSLFSLHAVPFTILARQDAGVAALDDLKSRRVNIGAPGSGPRAMMNLVMEAKGWTKDDFQLAEELPAAQQSLALCHDRVQVMVDAISHPHDDVRRVATHCDAALIGVDAGVTSKLLAAHPYFNEVAIPGGLYPNNSEPVQTFGVPATVVTSVDVSDETVRALVAAVFENLDRLRRMHPALSQLDPAKMVTEGLTAPLHDGAAAYYQEQGLM
ncbi:MAG: TAXI family TRAP transporter solute-binding subunit [Kiloniellales bacterium]